MEKQEYKWLNWGKGRGKKAIDILVIMLAVVLSVSIWLPTRYDPSFWDSSGFVFQAIEDLITNKFDPLIATGSDFAHPPGYIAILALVWQASKQSLMWMHVVNFVWLPMLIISVYFFCKKYSTQEIAVAVALLTGITPVVVAEYGQIYLDLPASALLFLSLVLWQRKKHGWAVMVLGAAALTKYTIFLGLPLFWLEKNKDKTKKTKPYGLLVFPFLIVLFYLTYHYFETGWFIAKPGRLVTPEQIVLQLPESIAYMAGSLWWRQGRLVLTAMAGLVLLVAMLKPTKFNFKPKLKLVAATVGAGMIFFAINGEFAMRYGILYYPLVYLLTIEAIRQTKIDWPFVKGWVMEAVVLVAGGTMLFYWHPKEKQTEVYDYRMPSDLAYRDIMTIFRQAGLYSGIIYPKAVFYGGFPENLYWQKPELGYVTKSLNFKLCNDFVLDREKQQIILIHPYSPSQTACRLLLNKVETSPIHRHEVNGKWLEFFEVTATEAGKLDVRSEVKDLN